MNRYYTPKIEEFHIGFEYEYYSPLFEEWKQCVYADLEDCYHAVKDISQNLETKYRVKYLDNTDIEELGFRYKAKTIDLWFEKQCIYLREDGHHLNNIKLQYGLHDNKLKITFCYVSGEEQIHFEGKIKNKNELIKLLKQLEIN